MIGAPCLRLPAAVLALAACLGAAPPAPAKVEVQVVILLLLLIQQEIEKVVQVILHQFLHLKVIMVVTDIQVAVVMYTLLEEAVVPEL